MKITPKLREQAATICAYAACNSDMMLSDIAEYLGHPLTKGYYQSVELASAVWLEITGFGSRDVTRDAEAEAMLHCGYVPTKLGDYE